ncbi:MAG: hypothetical protein P8188_20505 [Gemmatimonadota bacterium]
MGVGRLALALRSSPFLVLVSKLTRSTTIQRGDLFIHWGAGFTCRKPSGWSFQWPENPDVTFGRILIHGLPSTDQVALADVVELGGLMYPLVCAFGNELSQGLDLAMHPDVDRIAPCFTVSAEALAEEREGTSLMERVDEDLVHFKRALRDFRVQSPPGPSTLSKCEAVEYSDTYLLGHDAIPEWIPTRERVIYVRGAWADFSVRMYDYPEVSDRLVFDFEGVIGNLRFA